MLSEIQAMWNAHLGGINVANHCRGNLGHIVESFDVESGFSTTTAHPSIQQRIVRSQSRESSKQSRPKK